MDNEQEKKDKSLSSRLDISNFFPVRKSEEKKPSEEDQEKEKKLYLKVLMDNLDEIITGVSPLIKPKLESTQTTDEKIKITEDFIEKVIGPAQPLVLEKSKRDVKAILKDVVLSHYNSYKKFYKMSKGRSKQKDGANGE